VALAVEPQPKADKIKPVVRSEFWFEDGNIVVQAQRTQFRLHRSVLSMQSPIFRDMFAYPQPEDGPTVDGCPLVHLPESSKDVRNFVKLLYDAIKTYVREKPVSASLLKTMLHFGKKYEMEMLRQEAISCLLSEFPADLDKWSDESPHAVDIYRTANSLFALLAVAHEHSITSVLPAIYLRICLVHDLDDIFYGFKHISKDSLMANQLFINCLSGREALHRSVSRLTLTWLRNPNQECKVPKQCWKEKTKLITELWDSSFDECQAFVMSSWKKHQTVLRGLCSACLEVGRVAYSNGRIINWEELKTNFGLDDVVVETCTDIGSYSSSSTESD